jgi:aconitate hydratase
MGAELGVTTSIFASDEQTRRFLAAQKRQQDYQPLAADPDAEYDRIIEIDLVELEPMAACPSSPDNVKTISDVSGIERDPAGSDRQLHKFELRRSDDGGRYLERSAYQRNG